MQSGQRVGKYVLGERIAHGGMAEVWAARVEGPGGFVKPLALKFIRESFAGDSELERLFVNEARLSARLQHANLVGVFDFDRLGQSEAGAPSRYYIAMERVEGHDLRRVMHAAWQKGHRIPVGVALYVAGEVLKGLRYVHERRDEAGGQPLELVHRDVSPHNVLIGRDGDVKLSDFGIAKARALTGNVHTQAGTVRGKLAYAAPEQLRAEVIDHRADQFALGILLWELLAHRRLFDGASEKEIIDKVVGGTVPVLPTAAAVDPAVERLARRMLSLRPADRYPSTADALNALLTAPGYSPDARPLVELMRALFEPQPVPVPRTIPMDLADPAPAPPPAAQAPTVELERPLLGDATGSSYVSDRSSALRSYARPARSRVGQLVLATAVLGVGAVGAGVGLRRLVARAAVVPPSLPNEPLARPPSAAAAPPTAGANAPAAGPPAAGPPPTAAPPNTNDVRPAPAAEVAQAPPPLAAQPERVTGDDSKATVPAARPLVPAQLRDPEPPGPAARPVPVSPPAPPPAALSTPPLLAPAPVEAPPSPPPMPSRVAPRDRQSKGNVPNAAPILE